MEATPAEAIEQLRSAIDIVVSLDPGLLGASVIGDVLEAAEVERRRLDHCLHDLLRRFETRGGHRDLGYRTLDQWQRDRLALSSPTASRRTRLARQLSDMPTVAKRWADGAIDDEAVRLIATARCDDTTAVFDEWEPWFADVATDVDHDRLRTAVRAWRARVDTGDGTEPAPVERTAHISPLLDGTVAVDAVFDAIGGEIFRTEAERLTDHMFERDWADAKVRLGREPTTDELARTPAQRRADALVEMATRSAAADVTDTTRPRPLLSVVLSVENLADALAHHWRTPHAGTPPAELWDRQPLTPAEVARLLAADPDIERFVFGGPAEPIRHNPRRRLFTGKLRRAIQLRDRHCQGRGCTVTASRCDVDHDIPVAEGGLTTAANGRLAWGPCNRARPNRRFNNDPDPP